MSKLTRLLLVTLVPLLAACGPPPSEDDTSPPPGLEILEPRAHVLPGGMGVVYLSIRNGGAQGDRLVAVETAAAAAAETHESLEEGGVMRMVPRPEGFAIPARGTLELRPGGKHVMLIEPRLDEGAESIPLTLRFEHAEPIAIEVPLTEMGTGGMDHGMGR